MARGPRYTPEQVEALSRKHPMAQYATTLEEVLALRSETARMRRALEKIRKAYVDAPGMAAPIPTTELIWKMYSLAGDGLAVTNGQENTDG